jgi:subtilase family serine protease
MKLAKRNKKYPQVLISSVSAVDVLTEEMYSNLHESQLVKVYNNEGGFWVSIMKLCNKSKKYTGRIVEIEGSNSNMADESLVDFLEENIFTILI